MRNYTVSQLKTKLSSIADLLRIMLTNQDAVTIMAHAAIKGTAKADASEAA